MSAANGGMQTIKECVVADTTPGATGRCSEKTQFDYLLNAFEEALASEQPALCGYANKRSALFNYVRKLEVECERLSEENAAIRSLMNSSVNALTAENAALRAQIGPVMAVGKMVEDGK